MKTHCVNGHPFTTENTRWRPYVGKPGQYRQCITCLQNFSRARYERWYRSPWKNGERQLLQRGGVGILRAVAAAKTNLRGVRPPQPDVAAVPRSSDDLPGATE